MHIKLSFEQGVDFCVCTMDKTIPRQSYNTTKIKHDVAVEQLKSGINK